MDEFYNKHYAAIDDGFKITSIWSDGPCPQLSTKGAVCINDQGGYQVYLMVDGVRTEENPQYLTDDGIPLYKWDGAQVIRRTQEEIEADRAALPVPEVVPTAQEDTDSMLVDHEYHITLLELGITDI